MESFYSSESLDPAVCLNYYTIFVKFLTFYYNLSFISTYFYISYSKYVVSS